MRKKASCRAAGHLARGVPGKAMLTAAVRTRGLSPGSAPAQLAPECFTVAVLRCNPRYYVIYMYVLAST